MSRTFGRAARLALTLTLGLTTLLHAQQAPQTAPAGDIVGVGNFGHIVADLDKPLGFYRDVLGLTVTGNIPYGPNDAVAKFGHTEVEYKDIERKAQNPRFVDPGAANLSMRVRNLDGLFPKIAAYPGVKILSKGGKPVTITTPNGTLHAVFVQDPDGFVVEMLDAKRL